MVNNVFSMFKLCTFVILQFNPIFYYADIHDFQTYIHTYIFFSICLHIHISPNTCISHNFKRLITYRYLIIRIQIDTQKSLKHTAM